MGIEALDKIHMRASYELYEEVLLVSDIHSLSIYFVTFVFFPCGLQVSNAIRNSLRVNPSGRPHDGPMGITLALSPVQRDDLISKHAITNASFRAKRLPGLYCLFLLLRLRLAVPLYAHKQDCVGLLLLH